VYHFKKIKKPRKNEKDFDKKTKQYEIFAAKMAIMLHEFKMLRLLNYGYYCEEIWNEEENHPDQFKEAAIREYEEDEFKY
jgi:hypothetical protein